MLQALEQDHPDHGDEVSRVLDALAVRGLTLAVAEGDSGGLLLEWLTAVPGSSAVVLGGVVAYHDELKQRLLGVEPETLARYGAVSAETARAMAVGVRELIRADMALATTGIAGPGGGTLSKPVGLAFVAVADAERALVREHRWQGQRGRNRQASAQAALRLALELLHA
ncbi:MAG: CinA family protein [Chloroflexota bacterium]